MYNEVVSKYDVLAISEGAGSTFADADRKELQMAYHFETVDLSRTSDGYTLKGFKMYLLTGTKLLPMKAGSAFFCPTMTMLEWYLGSAMIALSGK